VWRDRWGSSVDERQIRPRDWFWKTELFTFRGREITCGFWDGGGLKILKLPITAWRKTLVSLALLKCWESKERDFLHGKAWPDAEVPRTPKPITSGASWPRQIWLDRGDFILWRWRGLKGQASAWLLWRICGNKKLGVPLSGKFFPRPPLSKGSPIIITDLVKTIYLMTAIPLIFRTLLKNWISGRSGLWGSGFNMQRRRSRGASACAACAPREVLTPERWTLNLEPKSWVRNAPFCPKYYLKIS